MCARCGQQHAMPMCGTATMPTFGDPTMSQMVKHIPLAKCRVLYLGSAVPLDAPDGLEAFQRPLQERYPTNSSGQVPGIDVILIVFSSGIMLKYLGDQSLSVWFPIYSLRACGAVKCSPRSCGFVPLDSSEAQTSSHPPIFASIMRRNKGIKVLECHSFVCKSDRSALELVHAVNHAYEHQEGWTDHEPTGDDIYGGGGACAEATLIEAEPIQQLTAAPAFYEKPPLNGYFYSSNKELIRNYNVHPDQDRVGRSCPQRAIMPMSQPQRAICQPRLPSPAPAPAPVLGVPVTFTQTRYALARALVPLSHGVPQQPPAPGLGGMRPIGQVLGPPEFFPLYFEGFDQRERRPLVTFPEANYAPRPMATARPRIARPMATRMPPARMIRGAPGFGRLQERIYGDDLVIYAPKSVVY